MRSLIGGGNYLFRLDRFLNQYFIGLLLNLVPWLSLLAVLGAGTAQHGSFRSSQATSFFGPYVGFCWRSRMIRSASTVDIARLFVFGRRDAS